MKYLIRLKAVSECIGIRRSHAAYLKYEDKEYNQSLPHPMNSFKEISLKRNILTVNGKPMELKMGEEAFFYKNRRVESLGKLIDERIVMGALLMPLDKSLIKLYEGEIEKGMTFDEWNGEFEFIIAAIYDLELNDSINAKKYYDLALDKGFKFGFL